MIIEITCFKESGKYYSGCEAEIPDNAVELIPSGGEHVVYLPDLLNYVRSNPETWPVTDIGHFNTLITKNDESDNIFVVPHILPKTSI